MFTISNLKTLVLGGLVAIGLIIQTTDAKAAETRTLTVAGGCFWCVEADFEKVKGVKGAVSGFAGGNVSNPTYKQVTAGGTGHYEAVQIRYDPDVVSAATLLDLFFRSIDPTDAGGQFCDRGDSYKTAIFAADSAQEAAAKTAKANAAAALGQNIVTPVLGNAKFWPADAYHQDYYKGKKLVITRFGPKRQSAAYKAYRDACGRDARVKQLWGDDAPFAG
ncbi:peptide-methionine (S)-S-oxide reductase MsrA [Sulfitobacter sp. S190]|uniref:peptide-methionine (S)-S-oxide reductase MsrA n=1 Tax=Sulfitobacter sp. S190 TaxID=2867022 RepID=UPI0021A29082|nr:peptide-methionine (S)-S-oxide reductase MsrA [Sulfitobacter sp. S190]UWR22484.1 peptide-methionine (S)-S-oxide reductase MsrA [Sulfitobacter sp. S190]